MKTWPLTTLALVASPLLAVQQETPKPVPDDPFVLVEDGKPKSLPRSVLFVRSNEEAIRKAIRDTLDERQDNLVSLEGPALSGGAYREFARKVSEAKKPHCLGPDPLKHQPASTVIGGWNVGVGGILALPFWAAAIVRGKCNWTR